MKYVVNQMTDYYGKNLSKPVDFDSLDYKPKDINDAFKRLEHWYDIYPVKPNPTFQFAVMEKE